MQGGEEVRSEAYLVVRCNDERRSQRRKWAFFISLLVVPSLNRPSLIRRSLESLRKARRSP